MKDSPLPEPSVLIDWARKQSKDAGATFWVKAWTWQGYVGWSVGPLSWGQRIDSTIVRASGRAAAQWFANRFPIGHNVSRLDIQATVWIVSEVDARIALHNEQALQKRETLANRPYKVRLVKGFGDGDTLYLGARTSELFIRIYNKEKEQASDENYQGAIRYECELKNETALRIAQRLAQSAGAADDVAEFVAGYCLSRGVVLDVRRASDAAYLPYTGKSAGDLESSLVWLTTQVAPTIRRLRREGYLEQALLALGVSREDLD